MMGTPLSRCQLHWVLHQNVQFYKLTPKHRETHGCVVSTVATDALVLKHQAISIHNADKTLIILEQFYIKLLHIRWTASENEFWKNMTQSFKG